MKSLFFRFPVAKHEYCNRLTSACFLATSFSILPEAYALSTSTPVMEPEATPLLEEMTIIGEQLPANQVTPDALPGFVSVIPRAEFEGKLASLPDVLKKQTSIQVRETGGLGSLSFIYLRGSSSQQVNVYLDGVLLNNIVTGLVDLSRISLSQVQSIEIYRGAPPVQFGQSAIGGAINITTIHTDHENTGELSLGYGSFGRQKADLSLNYRLDRLTIKGAFGYQSSDNDFKYTNDNQTPLNPNDDKNQKRNNAAVEMLNGLFALDYAVADEQQIKFGIQHYDKNQDIPDLANTVDNNTTLDSSLTQINLDYIDNQFDFANYTVGFVYARNKDHYADIQGRIGTGAQNEISVTDSFGIAVNANRRISNHLLAVMTEWRYDDYLNKQATLTQGQQQFSRHALQLSVQDEMDFMENRGLLQLGIRFQDLQDKGDQPVTENDGFIKDHNNYFSWQSGVRVDLTDWLTVKSNLSRGTRVPRLTEKFGDRGLFKGNPDLVAEEAINADIGFQATFAHNNLGDLSLGTAYFQRWLDNAIVTTYDSQGVGKYENISEAEIRGIELEARYDPAHWLALNSRTTIQDTENTSNIIGQKGKNLAGNYELAQYLSLLFTYDRYSAQVEYEHESGGFYDNTEAVPIPDRDQINLTLKWNAAHQGRTRLTLELKNITDENFEAFNGYPNPGRHFLASVL
ncbi:MAG: TonB-dependent receptor, partial [Pseudomonadales bacterium]|nr:TonB-dependent receptor [Pseudomonadales bacterium]